MLTKKRRRQDECPYCGAIGILSKEHVFPQCLVEGLPADMIEIYVCEACNNLKSKDDDYLRDMLTGDARGLNDLAKRLFEGKVSRSIGYGSSVLGRAAKQRQPFKPVRIDNGPEFLVGPAVPADEERILRIFSTIVRGLYYHDYGERFSDDRVFEIQQLAPAQIDVAATVQRFKDQGSALNISCGGACMHMIWRSANKPHTAWLIQFYQKSAYCYYIAACPAGDPLPASSVTVGPTLWLPF